MAIKRYWRLIGANTSGGTALDLSECRLYEGGVIADSGATLTCTIAPATGTLSDLRDGVATAVASWPVASYSAPGWALSWDFGVGGGVDAPKLRLGSGTTQANWLLDATLQYCTDGVSWVTYLAGIAGISYPGANALTTAPDASAPDIYSANNSLLLLGNGANGSTSIIDSSVTNTKTVTAVGNAQISTAQSKFGGSSIYFDGSADYLTIPNSALMEFGAGDFTIEFYLYRLASSLQIILSTRDTFPSSGAGQLEIAINPNGTIYFYNGLSVYTTSLSLTNNAWCHFAASYASGVLTLYINGGSAFSGAVSASWTYSTNWLIGKWIGGTQYNFAGYMHLRITKGLARYTATFTPPGSFADAVIIPNTYTARATRLAPVPERLLPAVELPNTTASTHAREYTYCDIYYGGDGSITGTVKEKHSPANTPLFRRVLLIDERSQQVIRETWSDATTGNFAFAGIKIGPAYSTVSFDHLHNYRAQIADNLGA